MITLLNGNTISDDEFYRWSAQKQFMSLCAPTKGRKLSNEHKAKASASLTGKKHTESTRQQMSASKKGVAKPAGFGDKMSAIVKGRKLSDSCRSKMSMSAKQRKPHSPATKAKMAAARKEFHAKRKMGVV